MYQYIWDAETNGLLLTTEQSKFSKEPRPVYYKELDILGFDQYWTYPKDDSAPLMWAEANNYIYKGRNVARTKGGSLYTKPEIIILEDPETDGAPLQFVDVEGMCWKNQELMETLVQETIQKIYNTFLKYKEKVDLFYLAFSGGKDSVVALDLVQRALPHDSFKVLFGNTDMEFPTTLKLVDGIRRFCKSSDIDFHEASAGFPASQSWHQFGPPARRVRWCCTVHKTAPVINKLCELYDFNKLHTVMITGVRGDESATRADYDEISLGKKLAGQYSFHPILEWSSAEVYLYIYMNNLLFNEAYKYGFNRVGCIMCPNSSERHEYIKRCFFKEEVDKFCKVIIETSRKDLSGNNARLFLDIGGWKTRLSGRELVISENERFSFEEREHALIFKVINLRPDWIEWYKTIGALDNKHPQYVLEYQGIWRKCTLFIEGRNTTLVIENDNRSKNSIEFVYYFKCILAKTQYCIQCGTCIAECPYRNISMDASKGVHISEKCVRCHACLKILGGCLYYNSVKGSKDMASFKGINRYLSVGVDAGWVKQYLSDQDFEPGNRKTDTMFSFLDDAGITKKRHLTDFGQMVQRMGLEEITWALMLCNLVYAVPFRWYVENIPFDEEYGVERLTIDMEEAAQKARGEFWNGFKVILDSNEVFQRIGFGKPDITSKATKTGEVKKTMNNICRSSWDNPVPEVILYSLYKFAEACGDYYQFSLETLMDDTIERNGVSPTRIFGIDRDEMVRILNGLSINYPEFISASFTLDLDNITLRDNKTSEDVLGLF